MVLLGGVGVLGPRRTGAVGVLGLRRTIGDLTLGDRGRLGVRCLVCLEDDENVILVVRVYSHCKSPSRLSRAISFFQSQAALLPGASLAEVVFSLQPLACTRGKLHDRSS